MKEYVELISNILDNGIDKIDRTGIGTRFINGAMLKFNLQDGFPIITTRKMSLRLPFEETMMFLRGEINTKTLEEKNINIWKGNTSREFLDNRGLQHLPEGSIGTGYSHQWRNFGGTSDKVGVDQIKNLLTSLKETPFDRRQIVTAWNPLQIDGTPLPPCHLMFMYTVTPDYKLNGNFILRSSDVYLGLGFNIIGYALLLHIFAKYLKYEVGELTYFGWDVHLYINQIEQAKEQIKREPRKLPEFVIHKELNTFDDIMNLEFFDVELIDYDPYPSLKKVDMAI